MHILKFFESFTVLILRISTPIRYHFFSQLSAAHHVLMEELVLPMILVTVLLDMKEIGAIHQVCIVSV